LPRDFKIYYCEKISDEISEHVERVLKEIFALNFRNVGVRIPRHNAFDEVMNAYDVNILMRNALNDGISFFLWLIDDSLKLDNEKVFGYAEPLKGAIVSQAKMATKTLVAKEVAYFVGIVLGLKPCQNECLMATAHDFEELIKKPSTFCDSCSLQYKRLKIRYI